MKYEKRNWSEFILYNIWDRNDLDEVWVYDKLEKKYIYVKYGDVRNFDLLGLLFNMGITKSLSGRPKRFNKVHDDDFMGRITKDNYVVSYF